MNKQLGDKRRNIQVEGLRGAAILCVVLYHVFCRFKQIYTGMDICILNHSEGWVF